MLSTTSQIQIFIYFIYGLSFFILGINALHQRPLKHSDIPLLHSTMLLGLFGILHACVEWMDMFTYIFTLPNPMRYEQITNILLILSFGILLSFGISLLTKSRLYIFAIPTLLCVIIIPFYLLLPTSALQILVCARYFIAFPASVLAAIGLYRTRRHIIQYQRLDIKIALFFSVFSFALYSVLSGIFVPSADFFLAKYLNTHLFYELFHVPIELVRALTTIVLSISFTKVIKISILETQYKFSRLQKQSYELHLREQFGQILHDGVIQNLFACGLLIDHLQKQNPHSDLLLIKETLHESILDIRRFIQENSEMNISHFNFSVKYEEMIQRFQKASHIPFHVNIDLPSDILQTFPTLIIENLFYITQEAISNALKHSGCTAIDLHLQMDLDGISLRIHDNGTFKSPKTSEGYGLASLKQRTLDMKGTYDIDTHDGTTISIKIDWSTYV